MRETPSAVPIKPEDIPQDLICAICMGLPPEPVLTPCEHLFCRDCLQQALIRQRLCPVDRTEVTGDQVRHLSDGSLLHRIWGGIPVKCANHLSGCAWTGPIADYKAHLEACSHGRDQSVQHRIEELREENRELRILEEQHEREIDDLRAHLTRVEAERDERVDQRRYNEVKDAITEISEQLKKVLEENKSLRRRPNVEPLFTGNYIFGRDRVVQLSQLIARYLTNKPGNIDADRIYNCVEACYRDLRQGWHDNPPHYYVDVRMLLATCVASTWFTDNQVSRIQAWMSEQSWDGF